MNKVLNTVLSLAALLALGAVTVGITQLGAAGTTPAPQATAAPASVTATTEISATNTTTPTVKPLPPRAGPDPLVIRGDKGSLFPLFHADLNDVAYTTVPLVVWSIDPTTMAPTDTITNYVVSWLPAAGSVNMAPLSVQPNGSACDGIVNSEPSQPPVCFTVAVTQANTLPTGEYTSTLYISNNTGVESTVSVQVLVGRNWWTLIAIVALGVIASELWLQWQRSWQYQRGWKYRRNQWIEWLSSNSNWLRPPFQGTDADQAMPSVLRKVQAELRAQVKSVSDWLAQLQAGQLTMSDLAEQLTAIPALIAPIVLAGHHYLNPNAKPTPPKEGYVAPAITWQSTTEKLTDKIQAVIAAASTTVVNEVNSNTIGQNAPWSFLKTAAIDLSALKQTLLRAQHPLPFIQPELQAMNDLQNDLTSLNDCVDKLHVFELADEVVSGQMFGPLQLRTDLDRVDAKLADPKTDLGAYWNELLLTYWRQERVTNLGSQIGDLLQYLTDTPKDESRSKQPKAQSRLAKQVQVLLRHAKQAQAQSRRVEQAQAQSRFVEQTQAQLLLAYEHLLSGQSLDAEIAIKRAEHDIYTYEGNIKIWPKLGELLSRLFKAVIKIIPNLYHAMTTLKLWMIIQKWIHLLLTETFDVFWPKVLRFVMWLGSLLLSLAIAVTIVIAAQEVILKNNVYTWGSNLDLIVAFTWGVAAHRLVQGLQSSLSSDKPATETAKAAEGK